MPVSAINDLSGRLAEMCVDEFKEVYNAARRENRRPHLLLRDFQNRLTHETKATMKSRERREIRYRRACVKVQGLRGRIEAAMLEALTASAVPSSRRQAAEARLPHPEVLFHEIARDCAREAWKHPSLLYHGGGEDQRASALAKLHVKLREVIDSNVRACVPVAEFSYSDDEDEDESDDASSDEEPARHDEPEPEPESESESEPESESESEGQQVVDPSPAGGVDEYDTDGSEPVEDDDDGSESESEADPIIEEAISQNEVEEPEDVILEPISEGTEPEEGLIGGGADAIEEPISEDEEVAEPEERVIGGGADAIEEPISEDEEVAEPEERVIGGGADAIEETISEDEEVAEPEERVIGEGEDAQAIGEDPISDDEVPEPESDPIEEEAISEADVAEPDPTEGEGPDVIEAESRSCPDEISVVDPDDYISPQFKVIETGTGGGARARTHAGKNFMVTIEKTVAA